MLFSEIIGQEQIKNRLIRSVRENRIAHAQLFCGSEGVGKMPLALAYAQYLCCENPTDKDSCGICPSCIQFKKLTHPDCHFTFPIVGSDNVCNNFIKQFRYQFTEQPYTSLNQWLKSIGEENKLSSIYSKESEEINKKLSFKPYESKYKIMIIWMPEKMNITCANNILKLLEEPPIHTVFLLISEYPEQLLPTITSRTQRLYIPNINVSEIVDAIKQRRYINDSQIDINSLTEKDILAIAHLSNGNYIKTLELINNNGNNKEYLNYFILLMRTTWGIKNFSTLDKKGDALIQLRKFTEDIAKIGREKQKDFLKYSQNMIRENFINNFHIDQLNNMTKNEYEFSQKFSSFVNEKNIIGLMNELSNAQRDIEQNGQAKIIFYDLALKIIMLLK